MTTAWVWSKSNFSELVAVVTVVVTDVVAVGLSILAIALHLLLVLILVNNGNVRTCVITQSQETFCGYLNR
jgi:hypothetical protein